MVYFSLLFFFLVQGVAIVEVGSKHIPQQEVQRRHPFHDQNPTVHNDDNKRYCVYHNGVMMFLP